jgi:hypothetical protein
LQVRVQQSPESLFKAIEIYNALSIESIVEYTMSSDKSSSKRSTTATDTIMSHLNDLKAAMNSVQQEQQKYASFPEEVMRIMKSFENAIDSISVNVAKIHAATVNQNEEILKLSKRLELLNVSNAKGGKKATSKKAAASAAPAAEVDDGETKEPATDSNAAATAPAAKKSAAKAAVKTQRINVWIVDQYKQGTIYDMLKDAAGIDRDELEAKIDEDAAVQKAKGEEKKAAARAKVFYTAIKDSKEIIALLRTIKDAEATEDPAEDNDDTVSVKSSMSSKSSGSSGSKAKPKVQKPMDKFDELFQEPSAEELEALDKGLF